MLLRLPDRQPGPGAARAGPAGAGTAGEELRGLGRRSPWLPARSRLTPAPRPRPQGARAFRAHHHGRGRHAGPHLSGRLLFRRRRAPAPPLLQRPSGPSQAENSPQRPRAARRPHAGNLVLEPKGKAKMSQSLRLSLLFLLTLPVRLGAEPDATYQPLAFLAGHCWKGSFQGAAKLTDEHCFSWVYDGRFLRDRHVVRGEGQPDRKGESIYFWDSAAQRLEYLYIEDAGGLSRGLVTSEGKALVFPTTPFVSKGTAMNYRSRWERSAENAYEVSTEFEKDGSWVPGFKLHMERSGKAE